eukprot:2510902-Rhodomonas_salina.1
MPRQYQAPHTLCVGRERRCSTGRGRYWHVLEGTGRRALVPPIRARINCKQRPFQYNLYQKRI